jgi:hypothetical protein
MDRLWASGSGKSTVCNHLIGKLQQLVLLDSDILWRESFNTPENKYADFFETWLRMCKNIAQSGRPVVLFGAGLGYPKIWKIVLNGVIFPQSTIWHWFVRMKFSAHACEPVQPGGAHTLLHLSMNKNASISGF